MFAYPFRIFFLSLSVLAIVVVPLWVLTVTGTIALPLAMPGLLWHQHEMLFGFLSAAIAGFLLTAVCVWTQTERSHGLRLMLLWGTWLAGRLLLFTGAELPYWLVQGVNLAFLPLVMADAGWRVVHARQKRQLMILVVLGLFWAMQIGFVISLNTVFIQAALVLSLALISIIGGRITPAFTTGWLRQRDGTAEAVRTLPALDTATLASLFLLTATVLFAPAWLTGALAITAGVLTFTRLLLWQGWLVAREPLLWVLHLSILWVPVSLFLLAGSQFAGWPASAWTHAAGTGAIGCLILGVMARVALGHTGRPLILPGGMVLAFVIIQVAALTRVVTAFGVLPWHPGIGSSAVLWALAFGLFLWRYAGILSKPRADGREG